MVAADKRCPGGGERTAESADAGILAQELFPGVPECAAPLIARLSDPGPLIRYRCAQALAWLDEDNPLPISARIGADPSQRFALAVGVLVLEGLSNADRRERLRLTALVTAILREADQIRRAA
jgi:hypothetical protein